MSGLSQEARALIDGVADLDAPAAGDKARIQQRLAAQLGAAVFTTALVADAAGCSGANAVATTSLAPKSAWLGGLGKALLSAAALGGAGLALWLGAPAPHAAPATLAPRVAPSAPSVAAVPSQAVAPAVAPELVAAPQEVPAPAAQEDTPKAQRKAKVGLPAAATPSPHPDTLGAELALLGRAQAALRAGRPAEAQALAAEHRATYPNGLMKEERMGVAALAECALSPDNRAEAKAFLAQSANSPLAARVRKACELP